MESPSFLSLLQRPIHWEVELTTRCNSRCVGCSRYSEDFFPNPYFDGRVDLDMEILGKVLRQASRSESILFCGVYGDPLLHPQILQILDMVQMHSPGLKMRVHTNGSFGSALFWKDLASFFSHPGSHIKFALEGFKTSHEAFRRGTEWEKTIKNARAFIDAGGRAVWKMIEFGMNSHEVEEAKEMAKKMGFQSFELRANNVPHIENLLSIDTPTAVPDSVMLKEGLGLEEIRAWNRAHAQGGGLNINCKSLDRKSLYLDAHGDLWPCCWLGGLPYRPEHHRREWFKKFILEKYGDGFNSLHKNDLQGILNHTWFSNDLPYSWRQAPDANHNPLISTCAKTCGKCS